MSRYLPPHPNLDHLKKQAKDLLRALKQRNPASKLADAQYALAREYGFASWPKLKAYVESLPPGVAPTAMFDAVPTAGSNAAGMTTDDGSTSVNSRSTGMPEKANPFVGKWTADLSKSQLHPSHPFQSATLQFAVAGDVVTITDIVVDEAGREEHGKNTIRADGNEHLSEHGNRYVLKASWRGSHILETVATKEGQIVGWGTYEVSGDDKILTISGDQQVIVFERN